LSECSGCSFTLIHYLNTFPKRYPVFNLRSSLQGLRVKPHRVWVELPRHQQAHVMRLTFPSAATAVVAKHAVLRLETAAGKVVVPFQHNSIQTLRNGSAVPNRFHGASYHLENHNYRADEELGGGGGGCRLGFLPDEADGDALFDEPDLVVLEPELVDPGTAGTAGSGPLGGKGGGGKDAGEGCSVQLPAGPVVGGSLGGGGGGGVLLGLGGGGLSPSRKDGTPRW
jgi:hypothetical protein